MLFPWCTVSKQLVPGKNLLSIMAKNVIHIKFHSKSDRILSTNNEIWAVKIYKDGPTVFSTMSVKNIIYFCPSPVASGKYQKYMS